MQFKAVAEPAEDEIEAVARLAPANPFFCNAYVKARVDSSHGMPHVLAVQKGDTFVVGCIAYLYDHRWTRTLEIESLPTLGVAAEIFWEGLLALCHSRRVTVLVLSSYASEEAEIPPLRGPMQRRARTEHILDLQADSRSRKRSSQHRRNLKRARKAGFVVHSTTSDEAMRTHVKLMTSSLERRAKRGEAVDIDERTWRQNVSFLRFGAGEIFQAIDDGEVVSSILILLSERGAYYHSAGTSAAGRTHGASPFLIEQTRTILKERGCERFSLGGASPSEEGLYRFKTQFGGREVQLEAGRFYLGYIWLKKLRSLARSLRDNPLDIPKNLMRADRFMVYRAAPQAIAPPILDGQTVCVKLDDQTLVELSGEFREQAERFRRLCFNDAYAIMYQDAIAHVAWLVSPEHEQLGRHQNVGLRAGEAEITHCLTLPKRRGMGLYPLAIRHLCQVAASQGVRRVYMITNIENSASQRGIEKAGLRRCGTIIRVKSPSLPSLRGPVLRTHRWPATLRGSFRKSR